MKNNILYEDKDLIVAVKPPGMPAQPDKTGDRDIITELVELTGSDIFIINRLDRPVGGIMVFGKNEESAKSLSSQIQQKKVIKRYYAVICGKPKDDEGEFVDYLLKNQKNNMSKVVQKGIKNSKEAKLSYEVIEHAHNEVMGELTLVSIELETGRHHQIRVQFASRGLALWGDIKYNDEFREKRIKSSIGLWSAYVSFDHPITNKFMEFYKTPSEEIFACFKRV